jgi:hypothetical protein
VKHISYAPKTQKSLALAYLARGADADWRDRFCRFVRSYRSVSPGADHTLFIIFKGFENHEHLKAGQGVFVNLAHQAIFVGDKSFDIGAYAEAIRQLPHDRVCFLNTNSEVLCHGWLGKLAANLDQPRIGMAGATGSYESLWALDDRFPRFPNVHVRSNAFMMDREPLARMLSTYRIHNKMDAFFAESGPDSLTQRIFALGLSVLAVGRDGRGYPPQSWPTNRIFRQGTQPNLLVHDNVTRAYENMPWAGKRDIIARTWGNEHK